MLLHSVGINGTGVVRLNENTYDFDPSHPKDSWLHGAFLAFQKLKEQGVSPESFATIGTGSGVDSIGASIVFKLREIYQTDIHPNVIQIAQENAQACVPNITKVQTLLGDLCAPLIERGIHVDLLYANIPNIPSENPVLGGKVSSSRFQIQDMNECPKIFEKWLLVLQYAFLKQAHDVLTSEGIVLVAIGDRVPCEIMQELFEFTGYASSELVNEYKLQTETEEIVTGYADQEDRENIEFDFYDHEKALSVWERECKGKNLSVTEIKEKLKPCRLSAKQAFEEFQKRNRKIGHIYSIFKLTA